jgi:mannose-6-phosphate isomerase-like protein (cupin superfamily)
MNPAFTLDSTYIHLRPDESALAMEGGAKFWQGIEERHDQSKDWDHWERHPAGDEILTLLSGEMTIVLETDGGEQRTTIKPGETFIVPKGVWHRGIVTAPGRLMFVTPGAGTEHKPV